MSDYSSNAERDAFSQDIYDLVNEYLSDPKAFPEDLVLAVNNKTNADKWGQPQFRIV